MYVMWKCLDWDLKTCRWYSDSGTHGKPGTSTTCINIPSVPFVICLLYDKYL